MAFRYPEHPNTNRVDPFRDEQGRNPFADADADTETARPSENPYTPSEQTQSHSYQPGGYVTNEPGRGRLLFLMSSLGFVATAMAAGGMIIAFLLPEQYLGLILSGVTGPLLLGGAACWAVWLLARYDLAAMRAGAMERDTERKTLWAHRLGVAGTLLAVVPVLMLIVEFIRAIIEEF